ncbi:serine/threonine protein kinase ppk11, putative [Entamoeba invadens IP1]|uniref:Serine/threonine protein kinase ppk11, putative n=1 Tax=Entamoeba invadens IP1 TaxID=370355 RepID=A0A0A1U4J6_ENTIV|nr:serine/threonine protein kinase ppk11, putative [Entamoeba invadens IP1]ELP89124.1 serine/threonine protein kinase ppk11, putative [Entamoeba invadens IP1]|eukprot:XP_004255895.1 serine/threonine protein kinase ppk11, putative [Entamoeba invadens IP1]
MSEFPTAPFSVIKKYTLDSDIYKDNRTTIVKALESSGAGRREKQLVAIKITKVDEKKKKENERQEAYSRMMCHTDNPHVLHYNTSFYTKFRGELEYWSVMEYCSFQSLDVYWKSNPSIQQDENLFFISDIAVGLEYITENLHYQHLHLYPCNVLLNRDPASVFPKAKLSNFALCESIDGTSPQDLSLMDIDYAAPEFLDSYSHSRSDVWSFGILIYRLLVGRCPFQLLQMDTFSALQAQVVINVRSAVQNDMAADLLERMLKYDPDDRITMEEVLKHPFILMCKNHKYGLEGKRENYKAVQMLDHGNFGQVFLAETEDGTKYAVKEISNKFESLLREATCMRLCKHPNLVEYKDFFTWNKSIVADFVGGNNVIGKYFYLVMEYCDFGNLESYLVQKEAPLSNQEVSYFLGEVSAGLHYLHFNKRIVHRDLKPANLLLKKSNFKFPIVKIADYGFSRGLNDMMGSAVGTPIYEAPEIRKNLPYSSKSDLYSLGVILYRMATLEFPFTDDYVLFQNAMMNEQPVSFSEEIVIDEDLKDLIKHLITHHEVDRLSWKQFYEHNYVINALSMSKQIKPVVEEDDDFESF